MILTVTLNPAIDIVAPVKKLNAGSVSRTKTIYSYPGGKGTNVSRALSALGADTFATGFVGIRDSRETSHFLSHHNVDSDFVTCTGSNRICLLITDTSVRACETVINSESDIDITKKEISLLLKKLGVLSKKSSHVVLSGSLPVSLPADFYRTAVETTRDNAAVLLDTSSKYLMHGIKGRPQILKQNIHELESAFNVKLEGKAALKKFIVKISSKYGVPVIIVTLNEKGAVLFDRGSFLFYPALKVKYLVSPVGSGDAFSAGLVYGLSKGMDMEKSCKWAVAAAAANLERLGSCFIDRKNVLKYLKCVEVKSF